MRLLIPKERFRSKPALKIDHANDYAALEAENARLKEALRGCVEGYDKSMLYVADPENPFTAAITKAREVLGDETTGGVR